MMSTRSRKILVVDDEQNMRIALFEALTRHGYEVLVAEDGRMAVDMVERRRPDLVITDLKMPEMGGLALVRALTQLDGQIPVIVITGYGTVETAVQAMKLGVADYILKPFPVEVIEETVDRIFASRDETAMLKRVGFVRPVDQSSDRPIIGNDEKMCRLLKRAKSISITKATVLILGESGTGKELIARYIHQQGNRREAPFVAINCAALPEGLLESELFGHEKGAFTGAITTRKGKFELAHGGVLLLDEIGEIPFHLQAKLLRVLQEQAVDRIGGRTTIPVDVHVVATTNRDLEQGIEDGTFRQDLFYRLNVIPLRLSPLRERKGDIPILADYFFHKYRSMYQKEIKRITEAGLASLVNHPWPGNVRELENLIERAVLLCDGQVLDVGDFWEEPHSSANIRPPEKMMDRVISSEVTPLREVERQMIIHALHKTDNNRTHAAKLLGVSVRTLRNKLNEYRIQGLVD